MGDGTMDEGYALLADLEGPEDAAAAAAYARRKAVASMISRADAVGRATAYLREQGSSSAVYAEGAQPNPAQGLWILEGRDPQQDDARIAGGSVLVVPSQGSVYEIDYLPGAHAELLGLQSPAEVAGLPWDWSDLLSDHLDAAYWWELIERVNSERAEYEVYPLPEHMFAAFNLTSFEDVRVVLLGQDPYPKPGQAHGLSFSVPVGVPKPRSLINIHKLLQADLGIHPPPHGNLEGWAHQGVLLLNTALTVRHNEPDSHAALWAKFTDAVIRAISDKDERVVFVLWGTPARSRKKYIDSTCHRIVESAHPTSWPSASDPFLISKTFSKTNSFLTEADRPPIEWANVGLES